VIFSASKNFGGGICGGKKYEY